MSETQTVTPPPADIPATVPITDESVSFKDYRRAADEGKTEVVNPALAKAPVPEVKPDEAKADEAKPEDEANSAKADAELSEAARTLRRNRADERKAKIQREIDEAVREREQTRAEVERLRRERAELSQAAKPASPTAGVDPADPSDPVPTLEAFQAAHPQHPDPYAGWIEERALWRVRQSQKAEAAARQRSEAERGLSEAVRAFDTAAQPIRATHSDFDAVVHDLTLTPPMQAVILGHERGPALAYHLGTHPDVHRQIAALPPQRALFALGEIAASLASPAKPAAKPITSAPPAPSQTVGGSATATDVDTTKGVPFREHVRIENAREVEARERGYRY